MKKLLRENKISFILITIFAFVILSISIVYVNVFNDSFPAAVLSSVVVNLSNSDRANNGVKPLIVNPLLVKAAELKAEDMVKKSYFGHVNPDNIGTAHWFSAVNYNFKYAGENLAVNFSESDDVEKAWMNSSSHKSNILNSVFTDIGVAVARGELDGKPAIFVVQMFGTKMPEN